MFCVAIVFEVASRSWLPHHRLKQRVQSIDETAASRRPIAGFKEMLENNERNTETTFPPEHIFTYADLQASRALKACVYCWPAKSDGHGFHPSILDGALPDEQGSA